MRGAITWGATSVWARLFSAHRFGWYRYLIAYIVPTLVAARVAGTINYPSSMSEPVVAAALLLLWLLPGARVGFGYSADGVLSRRWLLVRRVPWSEVAMIELGVVHFDAGFRQGARLGGAVLRKDGRRMDLRGLPWFNPWRSAAMAPLLGAVRAHGVPVVLSPGAQRWFPDVQADLVGPPRFRDGAWTT